MTSYQKATKLARALLEHQRAFHSEIVSAAQDALYGPLLPHETRKAYILHRVEQLFKRWPADVLWLAIRREEAYQRDCA